MIEPKKTRFGRRPVGKQRTRKFMLTVGFAGTAVLLLMGVLSFRVADTVPGRSYYDVYAEFNEADNLANHYEVRIGGQRAGQVLDPKVENGRARVKLRLDSKYGPLSVDTKTRVRLRSAVGVRYLEVTPGVSSEKIKENGTIPASAQKDSVPLDAVLSTFDPKTREGVQYTLENLGGAFEGNGTALNSAIGTATPFFKSLGSVSKAITDKKDALRGLISGTGRTFQTFDELGNTLPEMFGNVASPAEKFADAEPAIHATIAQAPSTLAVAETRLPQVRNLLTQVNGLAREGLPTLQAMPASLNATTRLLRDSQPALRDADDTLDLVKDASPPTLRLLRRVRPELPDVSDLMKSLQPIVNYLEPRQCDLVAFTTGWGNDHKWGDVYGAMAGVFLDIGSADGNAGFAGILPGVFGKGARRSSYPGPCNGKFAEASGYANQTVEESKMGYHYTYDRLPGNGPNAGD